MNKLILNINTIEQSLLIVAIDLMLKHKEIFEFEGETFNLNDESKKLLVELADKIDNAKEKKPFELSNN